MDGNRKQWTRFLPWIVWGSLYASVLWALQEPWQPSAHSPEPGNQSIARSGEGASTNWLLGQSSSDLGMTDLAVVRYHANGQREWWYESSPEPRSVGWLQERAAVLQAWLVDLRESLGKFVEVTRNRRPIQFERFAMRGDASHQYACLLWQGGDSVPRLRIDEFGRLSSVVIARPTALVQLLQEVERDAESSWWALEAMEAIEQLTAAKGTAADVEAALARIEYLSYEGEQLAERVANPGAATRMRRARWAIERRLGAWHAARLAAVAPPVTPATPWSRLAMSPAALDRSAPQGLVFDPPALPTIRSEAITSTLQAIERYEAAADPSTAETIAGLAQGSSPLAGQLDENYRNANLRVSVSRAWIERLVPAVDVRQEPVSDVIAGSRVRGSSLNRVGTTVELLPSTEALQIGLQLSGESVALTAASERNVRVRSQGTTRFIARKVAVIDRQGLRMGATSISAANTTRLVSIRSPYDGLPIIGSVVHSKAIDEFRRRQPIARREVEAKVSSRAQAEFEQRLAESTQRIETAYADRVSQPLERLGISVEPIELKTTPDRLVARLRLARESQLAAHTPRPRAPGDSLLSVQVHESAINNLLSGLGLEGQRLTVDELRTLVTTKLPRLAERSDSAVEANNTVVEFADSQAVAATISEGEVKLTIEIVELRHGRTTHANFKVHTYYRPQVSGMQVDLVHSQGPYIEGKLRNGERLRLHGILGAVVGEGSQMALVPAPASSDPRWQGMMFTQCVLDDGWIGLALGPALPQRTAMVNRYKSVR